MKKIIGLLIFICLPILNISGMFFGKEAAWNSLKVTWGIGPFNFNYMPRTVKEAMDSKFTALPDSKLFCGKRYTNDVDRAVILLYDKNGYIAGIQTSIPRGSSNDTYYMKQTPPFVNEGDYLTLTAYFVDPAIACGEGRSANDFKKEGTGTVLLIQNSRDPLGDKIEVPLKESDAKNTLFHKNKCFFTMGMHYWYNTSADMDCDDFKPIFLLFNHGELNGFGWAFNEHFGSSRFEHPTTAVLGAFFDPVPNCLKKIDNFSTLHIFLTKYPRTNLC